jgi:hypothetical protein
MFAKNICFCALMFEFELTRLLRTEKKNKYIFKCSLSPLKLCKGCRQVLLGDSVLPKGMLQTCLN